VQAARREQPGRGAVITDGGVAAAGGEKLPDEAGEGPGEGDRFASEAQHLAPTRPPAPEAASV
jgi:hypothetical protein